MPDQYTRTRAQLGTPALDVLRRAHVAVFGIGGVGGQAVEVLAGVTAGLFGEQAEPFEPEPGQPVLVFDDQGPQSSRFNE